MNLIFSGIAWYGCYHGMLCEFQTRKIMIADGVEGILCICLIMDETFNVRMGLFAPQWSRMGHG
jgi:hypothetical protein